MSYIKDTKELTYFVKEFVVDFTKTMLYYAWCFISGVKEIFVYFLTTIFPIVCKELKSSAIEFSRIANSILYMLAYESSGLLSSIFLNIGKGCFALSDQFDRLARYLFPKSFGWRN